MQADRTVRDVLPGHPLTRHIDDFLTYLATANKLGTTICAYRGDLTEGSPPITTEKSPD